MRRNPWQEGIKMSQAINNDTIHVHVGRPKNDNKFCECGVELTFENTRETKKGSGSLRSICKDCERYKDRASHKANYKKHPHKKVSRGPLFAERPNRVGMAAQNSIVVRVDGKHIKLFEDALCEECGGILRYDEHLERVCTGNSHMVQDIYEKTISDGTLDPIVSNWHKKTQPIDNIRR